MPKRHWKKGEMLYATGFIQACTLQGCWQHSMAVMLTAGMQIWGSMLQAVQAGQQLQ